MRTGRCTETALLSGWWGVTPLCLMWTFLLGSWWQGCHSTLRTELADPCRWVLPSQVRVVQCDCMLPQLFREKDVNRVKVCRCALQLVISATDNGNPPLSTNITLNIVVIDVYVG
jgi:hypothetical protein